MNYHLLIVVKVDSAAQENNMKIYQWIKNKLTSKYLMVYRTNESKIKSYIINKPDLYNSFGNKEENRDNVGFRSYCHGRKSMRSFRHDRIVSLTKL